MQEPQEVEARASFCLLVGKIGDSKGDTGSFFLSQEQIRAYNQDPECRIFPCTASNSEKKEKEEEATALVFTTDGMRPDLSDFLQGLQREGLNAFGGTRYIIRAKVVRAEQCTHVAGGAHTILIRVKTCESQLLSLISLASHQLTLTPTSHTPINQNQCTRAQEPPPV